MQTTGDRVIDLSSVSKTYRGKVQALRDVALHVERGEVFGLLGPNGAGKSTLVKILLTIVRPTRCAGTMLGRPVGAKAALARVGYLPEHVRFPDYLTGAQALDLYGALAGVPRRDRRARAGELLELVGMKAWASRKLRTYSKGMKQRVGVAQALVNDPELVFLDEPTDGVDPQGRRDIRQLVHEMRRLGKTVVINSHLLSELEMVCDRVVILHRGRVVQQGRLDELAALESRYELLVEQRPESPAIAAQLQALGAVVEQAEEGWRISAPVADAKAIQPLIDALRAQRVVVAAVRPVRLSLEDLFLRAVQAPDGDSSADASADGARKESTA